MLTYGNYLGHVERIRASINFNEQMLQSARRKMVAASKDKTSGGLHLVRGAGSIVSEQAGHTGRHVGTRLIPALRALRGL